MKANVAYIHLKKSENWKVLKIDISVKFQLIKYPERLGNTKLE